MRVRFSAKLMAVMGAVALVFSAAAAQAQDQAANADPGLAVVKGSDCFTCHRVGQKLIGPSYKEVAIKYKGADDAKITELAQKVIKGGQGVWGNVPMRAHPTMTEEDAKKAVAWVLSLANDAGATNTAPAPAATETAPATTPTPAPTN